METATSVCPSCSLPILSEFYFCPNCGKALRSKPIVLSTAKLIGICLLSFFLPPFGLIHAIKYVRQTNTKTKVVGWVAIILTIAAYAFSIYSLLTILEQFNNTYGKLLQY